MQTLWKPGIVARALTVLALVLAPAGGAFAQAKSRGKAKAKPRAAASSQVRNIAILPIEGPNTAKIRTGIGKSLVRVKNKVKVLPNDRVDSTAEELGADLTSAQGKVTVAQELQVAAFVDGELKKVGKANAELQLHVYDGRTGEQVGSMTVKGKANAMERLARTRFWGKLGRVIMTKTKAPPKAEAQQQPQARPAPRAEPEEELAEESETPPGKKGARAAAEEDEDVLGEDDERPRGRHEDEGEAVAESEPEGQEGEALAALEIGARLRVMTRSYTYNDAVGQIAQHDLQPTPALRLEARWYPGAHFTTGVLSNLGLDMYYQVMYPVTATAEIGEFPTSSSALGVAARMRIPLSKHELGVLAGYSNMAFVFEDAENGVVAQVPSVSYGAFKLGGDARFQLSSDISLGAYAAYLVVQGFGELSSPTWFPNTTGNGLEVELRGGYRLSKSFEATAAFGLTLYGLSLNIKPSDQQMAGRIAGGVKDQYFNGGLGIVWTP